MLEHCDVLDVLCLGKPPKHLGYVHLFISEERQIDFRTEGQEADFVRGEGCRRLVCAVSQSVVSGRVARFFLLQNTKTGKHTKLPRTIPKLHKI
jgi:hypothetical protein